MVITLTTARFEVVKKLLLVVSAGISHGAATGEATADGNTVEWTADEVKFTIE